MEQTPVEYLEEWMDTVKPHQWELPRVLRVAYRKHYDVNPGHVIHRAMFDMLDDSKNGCAVTCGDISDPCGAGYRHLVSTPWTKAHEYRWLSEGRVVIGPMYEKGKTL